ncbi:hypothetical protein F7725_012986 [Dissostichus mawsoni]|uniref:RING-type domain-containing protein n=1 Tax=Dissostichus mawsoni TaxID=36200 RepID=A0A7J5YNU4_DISMA|nr:hypothetical protein F7725_012986 [Dissostichus mawsoni]
MEIDRRTDEEQAALKVCRAVIQISCQTALRKLVKDQITSREDTNDHHHRFELPSPSAGNEAHVFCSPFASYPNQILSYVPSETFIQDSVRRPPPLPIKFIKRARSVLVEVRTAASSGRLSQIPQTHIASSVLGAGEGEEDDEQEGLEDGEEGGSGVVEVTGQAMTSAVVLPYVPFGERRMSKREKNRIKCLRRRQRRRERWRQSQLQESRQSSTGNPSSSSSEDEEDVSAGDREGFICAVCLDVFFSPYMCHPCNHVFCEPCLRTLAKGSPTNTPAPSAEQSSHIVKPNRKNILPKGISFPETELPESKLCQVASPELPKTLPYLWRQMLDTYLSPKPGFQRQSSPIARRQFPHGGGYRLDALDFEDDSRGWRFDMDMVIIYIYSVNWIFPDTEALGVA